MSRSLVLCLIVGVRDVRGVFFFDCVSFFVFLCCLGGECVSG